MTRRLITLSAVALALAAACGGGGTPAAHTTAQQTASATGTAPADPAAARAEITATWERFFDAATPRAQAVALLEDGDQMGAALQLAEQERQAGKIDQKAKVKSVEFQGPTTAQVNYALLNGSTVLLPDSAGQAVLVDGQWKVSKTTFCTLVSLGNNGTPPPGC